MYLEGFDQFLKMNKNLSSPLNELNKVTTEMWKRLAEQNLEIISDHFSRFTNQIKRISSARKPEDFLSIQKDCVSENITANLQTMQKFIHVAMENMDEFTKIWGTTAAKISEKAVEKAQKYSERHSERHSEKHSERHSEKH